MKRQIPTSDFRPQRGFTMIEMLVVMGVIALLATITTVVVGNMLQRAREESTAATILKIHEQMQQRIESFHRAMKRKSNEQQIQQRVSNIQQNRPPEQNAVSRKFDEILAEKEFFRENFPQRAANLYGFDGQPGVAGTDDDGNGTTDDFPEVGAPNSDDALLASSLRQSLTNPGNHVSTTESAEFLYLALTSSVFGMKPVDSDAFSTSEVQDTDGDGLLEFVDAWGNPLRFYRWPTRLIKPSSDNDPYTLDTPNRSVAGLLIEGLPSHSGSNAQDPLNRDPDDPLGRLMREMQRLNNPPGGQQAIDLSGSVNETNWHTLSTYHAPLIVSAGADENLGLYEPTDVSNFGHLAQPLPGVVANPGNSPLNDNITNRNQRAGGN